MPNKDSVFTKIDDGFFKGYFKTDDSFGIYTEKEVSLIKEGKPLSYFDPKNQTAQDESFIENEMKIYPEEIQNLIKNARLPSSEIAYALRLMQGKSYSYDQKCNYLKCHLTSPNGDYTLRMMDELKGRRRY